MQGRLIASLLYDNHRSTVDDGEVTAFGDGDGHVRQLNPISTQNGVLQFVATSNSVGADVAVIGGDNINDNPQQANAEALAADLAGLTMPAYQILGHHDVESDATPTAYATYFTAMAGVIPTGNNAPENVWWPNDENVGANIDDPVCYSVSLNGFKLIFTSGIIASAGTLGFDTLGDMSGQANILLIDWLEDRLNEAESANEQPIIFAHIGIRPGDGVDFPDPFHQLNIVSGFAEARELIEGTGSYAAKDWKRKSIVVAGHKHDDQSQTYFNGVWYLQIHGDNHSLPDDDTLFAHAVLDVSANAISLGDGKFEANWSLTGYGIHTNSREKIKYLLA